LPSTNFDILKAHIDTAVRLLKLPLDNLALLGYTWFQAHLAMLAERTFSFQPPRQGEGDMGAEPPGLSERQVAEMICRELGIHGVSVSHR
jgi:hypothetical protein